MLTVNKKLLLEQVKENDEDIEKIKFGENEFYFLKKENDFEIRNEYIKIIGKSKLDAVINHMLVDTEFRHFMLVNLQEIFRRLRNYKTQTEYKYNCIIAKQEDTGIYQITVKDYIGFSAGMVPEKFVESSNAQIIDFIDDLTEQFREEISLIKQGKRQSFAVDSKKEIIEQVNKIREIGKFENKEIFISDKVALVKNSFNNEKLRAFFSAWQLNIFFEQFVAKFIEKCIGTKCMTNRKLFVLPSTSINKAGIKKHYGHLEIDVIGYDKNKDNLILVECKNGQLRESEISKFVGRTKIIEASYDTKIDKKIMVGTKYLDYFFKPLPKKFDIVGVNCFDNRDYRRKPCYKDLESLIKE